MAKRKNNKVERDPQFDREAQERITGRDTFSDVEDWLVVEHKGSKCLQPVYPGDTEEKPRRGSYEGFLSVSRILRDAVTLTDLILSDAPVGTRVKVNPNPVTRKTNPSSSTRKGNKTRPDKNQEGDIMKALGSIMDRLEKLEKGK